MNKQFQGSKKKARRKEFELRQHTKKFKQAQRLVKDKLLQSGDIELMALAMGVKLK